MSDVMSDMNMNARQPGMPGGQPNAPRNPEIVVTPRNIADNQRMNENGEMLAIAFVPMQRWEKLYEPDVAFARGTLFQALDLPFLGSEGVRHG